MQHVSDLHRKFALRHTISEVWQTSNLRRLRLGEEKKYRKKERRKAQAKNIMACPLLWAAIRSNHRLKI